MSDAFLGQGWQFPMYTNSSGEIALSQGKKDIDEAIRIILATRKGERIMYPDFGCGIHDFVFNVLNTATLTLVEYHIRDALLKWEPRIELENVKAKVEDANEGKLVIDIGYKVQATNTSYNLVYPFYIKEGQ